MIPENRPPTHPGEMLLEEFLRPLEMTQSEAARRMEIPLNRLNEVIRGRRGITADTALRLAKLLNTDPRDLDEPPEPVGPLARGTRSYPSLVKAVPPVPPTQCSIVTT